MIGFTSEIEIANKLNSVVIIKALEAAFMDIALSKAVQPPQFSVIIPNDGGDTILYSAAMVEKRLFGVTVSPYLISRLNAGQHPVTAFTLLISTETGLPVLLCDSKLLIAARTGATSVIAMQQIAKKSTNIAIIGSGKIAEWHLRCLAHVIDCERISMHSPQIFLPAMHEKRSNLLSIDRRLEFHNSIDKAVMDADVIMLCTSSCLPVLDISVLASNVLITSIGTDGLLAHEIPPAELLDMDVFCDYRNTTPLIAGEMIIATRDFGWKASQIVADLPELVSGQFVIDRSEQKKRRFFRSVGLGIEDLAAASTIL